MFGLMLTVALSLAPAEKSLDFWLGSWDFTMRSRTNPKADWTTSKGTNEVGRTLADKVILEEFTSPGLVGKSWSVYSVANKRWNQTWVDQNGGYLTFTGGPEGSNFILRTEEVKKVQSRMVFKNIQKDSFTWDWEGTRDGGKTWTLMLQIDYTRAKQKEKLAHSKTLSEIRKTLTMLSLDRSTV